MCPTASLFLKVISFAKISLILIGTSPVQPPSLFLEGMSFAKIGLILAATKIRLISTNDIFPKKRGSEWTGLVLFKKRLILPNEVLSKKREGGLFGARTC